MSDQTPDPRYDVIAIGNAIVDVLAHSRDEAGGRPQAHAGAVRSVTVICWLRGATALERLLEYF